MTQNCEDVYDAGFAALETAYVPHPKFTFILDKILLRIKKKMKGFKVYSLHIGGPSNAGKSALIEKVIQAYPRQPDSRQVRLENGCTATCDHVPVLDIEMPRQPTPDKLIREMLKALGDPYHLVGKPAVAEHRLYHLLSVAGTRVILIDEAQRAADRHGKVLQAHIGNLLQVLHDCHDILIIVIGLGRSAALLNQDSQIANRWANVVRFDPYEWGDPASPEGYEPPPDRYVFIGVFRALVAGFPLKWDCTIDLDDEYDLFCFYYAARGLTGLVKKTLHATLSVAEERQADTITWDLLGDAFDEYFMQEPDAWQLQNPFRENFIRILPPPLPDDREQLHPAGGKGRRGMPMGPSKTIRNAVVTDALTN